MLDLALVVLAFRVLTTIRQHRSLGAGRRLAAHALPQACQVVGDATSLIVDVDAAAEPHAVDALICALSQHVKSGRCLGPELSWGAGEVRAVAALTKDPSSRTKAGLLLCICLYVQRSASSASDDLSHWFFSCSATCCGGDECSQEAAALARSWECASPSRPPPTGRKASSSSRVSPPP